MITLNCDNCQEDGNCVCSDLRERKRGLRMKTNSELFIPSRHMELQQIINKVSVGGLWPKAQFVLQEVNISSFIFGNLIHLQYEEPDVDTGELCIQKTREWYIPKNATESEVLRTIHKLLLGSMEHRLDEHLTYKGVRIYDPHRPVAKGPDDE